MEEEAQTAEKKQLFRCHPPLFNRPHPWLVISHGYNLQRQTFYNLSEGRYYTKIIPELAHRNITHSIGNTGWMHLEDCLSDDCCLLNIVSMETMQLPSLPENTKIVNCSCVVSSDPTDPDCRVIFYECFHDVIITKPGDESFIKLELDHGVHASFVSATMFEGEIYGLTMPGCALLVAADTITQPGYFTQVPLELAPELLVQDSTSYLVESCGELLLVNQCWRSGFSNEVLRFQVFVADFSKARWVRLKNIGDRAIFMDRYQCFSCSTAELGGGGVKGNSIYFMYPEDRNIYVYNLEERSISISLPCPIVSSRYSVFKWIMMPGKEP